MTSDVGQFALTGQDALQDIADAVNNGSFVLSGQDAAVSAAFNMSADVGTFALAGQDLTNLSIRDNFIADDGGFNLTGQDAALSFVTTLSCDVGQFALTGVAVEIIIPLSDRFEQPDYEHGIVVSGGNNIEVTIFENSATIDAIFNEAA